jgi:hypothetical protein
VLLGELSIIVLGVMLAPYADAFVAERAERTSEMEHLVAFHSDLVPGRAVASRDVRERAKVLRK